MSMSQQIIIGNYIKVKSDGSYYDFTKAVKNDETYIFLENTFFSPGDMEDAEGYFFIVPNKDDFKDSKSIDVDDVFYNCEIEMPILNPPPEWDKVCDELRKQGLKFEKKYGILSLIL